MYRRVVASFIVLKDRIQKNIAKKSCMELARSRALTLCFLCAFIGTRVAFGYCSNFYKNEGARALTLRPVHFFEDPFRFMTGWFTRTCVHSNIRHLFFLSRLTRSQELPALFGQCVLLETNKTSHQHPQ